MGTSIGTTPGTTTGTITGTSIATATVAVAEVGWIMLLVVNCFSCGLVVGRCSAHLGPKGGSLFDGSKDKKAVITKAELQTVSVMGCPGNGEDTGRDTSDEEGSLLR